MYIIYWGQGVCVCGGGSKKGSGAWNFNFHSIVYLVCTDFLFARFCDSVNILSFGQSRLGYSIIPREHTNLVRSD